MMKTVLVTTTIFLLFHVLVLAKTVKNHGEPCIKKKECNQEVGLNCLKGFCACSSDQTVYSEEQKKCLLKIGRRCSGNDENETGIITTKLKAGGGRVDGGGRRRSVRSSKNFECIPNAECKKLRVRQWCRCLDGFMENENGTECTPVVKYGEFCNEKDHPCDQRSGTECIDGNCQCPYKNHQYFDQHEGRCVSFASGNCTVPAVSPCVTNAECLSVEVRTGTTDTGVKKIHTKTITQCVCKTGFSKTKNAICLASAGTYCSEKQQCNFDLDHLTCVDAKCKCRNPLHQTIDENGRCVNLVNSKCKLHSGPRCVTNSDCVDGNCQCREGFTMTPQKTCLLGYKETCEPNSCNKYSSLACITGRCECFDSFLVYDEETKACVGLSSSVQ